MRIEWRKTDTKEYTIVWFYFSDILEEAKLQRLKTDECLPGLGKRVWTSKWARKLTGVTEMLCTLVVVVVTWNYILVKTHWTIYWSRVDFIVCKLYLIRKEGVISTCWLWQDFVRKWHLLGHKAGWRGCGGSLLSYIVLGTIVLKWSGFPWVHFLSLLPVPSLPWQRNVANSLLPCTLILFLFCQVCSLERFRSLQDKLQLLEEAVSMHDGNVITAVSCGFVSSLIVVAISFWKSSHNRLLTFSFKSQVKILGLLLMCRSLSNMCFRAQLAGHALCAQLLIVTKKQ